MTDCAQAIAAFLRARRSADRADVLRAIFLRWPAITGAELQAAIDASRQPLKLARALEPKTRQSVGG